MGLWIVSLSAGLYFLPVQDVTPSLVPALWTLARPLCHEEAGSVGSAIALQHVRHSDN